MTEENCRAYSSGYEALRRQHHGLGGSWINRRFDEVIELLDVRKRVDEHERQIAKISQALNLKL